MLTTTSTGGPWLLGSCSWLRSPPAPSCLPSLSTVPALTPAPGLPGPCHGRHWTLLQALQLRGRHGVVLHLHHLHHVLHHADAPQMVSSPCSCTCPYPLSSYSCWCPQVCDHLPSDQCGTPGHTHHPHTHRLTAPPGYLTFDYLTSDYLPSYHLPPVSCYPFENSSFSNFYPLNQRCTNSLKKGEQEQTFLLKKS